MAIANNCKNLNICSSTCTYGNDCETENGACSTKEKISADLKCLDDKAKVTESLDQNGSVEQVNECEVVTEATETPDGGWGWFIILGCVIVRMITGGMSRSDGLFYKQFFERYHQSATATTWVTSLSSTVRFGTGPVVSILCNRFPERRLVSIGACALSISLFITGFAPNLPFLYFSFGVLGGIGRSLVLTPCILLLGYYFNKRKSLAFGLASAGCSLGGFVIPSVVEVMFQNYGFTGTFIVLSGLATHAFVSACILRPIELYNRPSNKRRHDDGENTFNSEDARSVTGTTVNSETSNKNETTLTIDQNGYHPKDSHDKLNMKRNAPLCRHHNGDANGVVQNDTETHNTKSDTPSTARKHKTKVDQNNKEKNKKCMSLSILKDIRFLTFLLALFLHSLPSTTLFLPSLAVSHGLTEYEAAFLLSITAGSDTVFRVIAGLVLDKKVFREKRPIIYNAMLFIQALTVLLIPSLWSFGSLALIVSVEGAAEGVKNAQKSVVMIDLLGLDKLASSVALSMAVRAAGKLLGPTISGLLKDIYGSYDGAFYFGGSAILAGALIMAGGNIRKAYIDRKAKIKTCTENSTS